MAAQAEKERSRQAPSDRNPDAGEPVEVQEFKQRNLFSRERGNPKLLKELESACRNAGLVKTRGVFQYDRDTRFGTRKLSVVMPIEGSYGNIPQAPERSGKPLQVHHRRLPEPGRYAGKDRGSFAWTCSCPLSSGLLMSDPKQKKQLKLLGALLVVLLLVLYWTWGGGSSPASSASGGMPAAWSGLESFVLKTGKPGDRRTGREIPADQINSSIHFEKLGQMEKIQPSLARNMFAFHTPPPSGKPSRERPGAPKPADPAGGRGPALRPRGGPPPRRAGRRWTSPCSFTAFERTRKENSAKPSLPMETTSIWPGRGMWSPTAIESIALPTPRLKSKKSHPGPGSG